MGQKESRKMLYPVIYKTIIERALEEDLGVAGDITTDAIVNPKSLATASIVARNEGKVSGLEVAINVFSMIDESISVQARYSDGDDVSPGSALAVISGSARSILTAERTALNVLGRMSGIATATRDLVAAIRDYSARIICTRKTAPGLRVLDKYSVKVGGGVNHRFGLNDGVLIKDNHRIMAGGVLPAIELVRQNLGHMVKVELEVDTLSELEEALTLGVDAVLLDNMSIELLNEAVAMVDGRIITEASGGITPTNITDVAASGVDLISLGWLTHSVDNWDVGLDFEPI
ncbi:MAG: putative nicotinate-nucleotide pyrophosphorylase [carboxylating] [Alphaproteobacteria bacterium MarineAlpha12_Bin1]|jgi:nicotinate-nucleotide pyrophosphorylase (carboxylating)|nr:MAG: putative nicotinate-nucleotide pyrophosphorylase [carboxylating] [Alphaproteobacteria bacterium MarineAlpha12_Bin1]|tara:strand:+ start:16801 stop:17667 length:867 start_codon:yes stop_codon:yes gene_type:complete